MMQAVVTQLLRFCAKDMQFLILLLLVWLSDLAFTSCAMPLRNQGANCKGICCRLVHYT